MIKFEHVDAKTVDEAVSALGAGGAAVMAGGTDLLTMLKNFVSYHWCSDHTCRNRQFASGTGKLCGTCSGS